MLLGLFCASTQRAGVRFRGRFKRVGAGWCEKLQGWRESREVVTDSSWEVVKRSGRVSKSSFEVVKCVAILFS